MEYTWIRNPIPVTVRTITIDKGSTRSSAGAWNEPTEIQSKSLTVTASPPSGILIHTRTPTTNDAPTSAEARPPATRRSGLPAKEGETPPRQRQCRHHPDLVSHRISPRGGPPLSSHRQ